MNFSRPLGISFMMSALFFAGCIPPSTPHSNPLAGWKGLGSFEYAPVPDAIKKDSYAYFQTLPEIERMCADSAYAMTYLEDGAGQHAVVLDASHDGEDWTIAVIYDRDNRRIKVLKYSTGSYAS